MKCIYTSLLYTIVILHFGLIIGILVSFLVLPFLTPFYIWLPLETFIVNLMINRAFADCPITKLENKLRKTFGKKEIRSFLGHYVFGPIRRFKRRIHE